MTARARRRVVTEVQAATGVSERRAIRFTGFPRATIRYQSRRPPQDILRARLRTLAEERQRWGYRRLYVMLRREGWVVNRKRVQRLYQEEGLSIRRRGKRRRARSPRVERAELTGPNQRWSLDFVTDTLSTGPRFRCLTIIDEWNRESLAIHPARSIPALGVIAVLERLRITRGLPPVLVTDNGPEFTSRAFDAWAYSRDVQLAFIQPGKPIQNCFIESFNATFRDECLNQHWFRSIEDARRDIDRWRHDYNTVRPHSALGDLPPAAFTAHHEVETTASFTPTSEPVPL